MSYIHTMDTPRTYPQHTGESRLDYLTRARRYARRVYNRIIESGDYPGHYSHSVALALRTTEQAFTDLGTFGVEGLCKDNGDPLDLEYLNTGDSYELTIAYVGDRFVITSWADEVERAERR